jgi:thiol peroxidase
MNERSGLVTFKGNPLTLIGTEIKVGDKAPEFTVVNNELQPVKLSDFSNKIIVLSVAPSLDTPVCDMQAKHFNKIATEVSEDVVILNISVDLPFALARWCGATGSDKVLTLSDYQEREFGVKYGILIKELKLLARSTWVIDKKGKIVYNQIVKETVEEPDYDAVLDAVNKLIK